MDPLLAQFDSDAGAPPAGASSAPLRANNPGAMMPGGRLATFDTSAAGLQAIDANLASYGKAGVNTLAGVINRWAPPTDAQGRTINDTRSYIADASNRLGLDPNAPIDLSNPVHRQAIATAIMLHENGPKALFGSSAPAQASAPASASSVDPLLAQFDADAASPAPAAKPQQTAATSQPSDRPSVIASIGAGAGKIFGSGVLALQQLAGYGLSKIGSVTGADSLKQAGDWLYNDATTGARNLEQQNVPYEAAHPVANISGQIGGFAGAMLTGAGDVLPFANSAPAAGLMSAAARGAVQGTVLNTLTSPAIDPNDSFLVQKAKQAILGAAGGGAGGVLGYGLSAVLNSAIGAVKGIANRITTGPPAAAADQAVTHALQTAGVDAAQMPSDLYAGLKSLAQKAFETGQPVDPQALARLAKAQTLPVPVNPMRFQLTRDPMDFAVNVNLRGITGVGEPITERMVQQNAAFLANLDTMGAKTGEDIVTAAKPVINTLVASDKAAQSGVTAAYNAFRNSAGKDLEVPLQGLAQDYAKILQQFGKAGAEGGVIPGGVSGSFDRLGLMSGKQLKVTSIENIEGLIKTINQNYDPANRPAALALDQLRQAAQRAITDGAGSNAPGAAAAQLAQQARAAAAARFQALDANPALRAAVSGVEPDKFLQRYALQGDQSGIQQMMGTLQKQDPTQAQALQDAIMRHVQGVATGFRPADKAIVSEAELNKIVNNPNSAARFQALLGPVKFGQLKQLADVVGDMKFAPVASAVNTSNTGSAGANLVRQTVQGGPLNATLSGLRMVPGLSAAANAAQSSLQATRAAELVGEATAPGVAAAPKKMNLLDLARIGAQGGAIGVGLQRQRNQQ